MTTLATTHPTLMDVARRLDPNGAIDGIVEVLAETNDVLDDMVWLEGNLETGHRTTIRTGLPEPTWRKLYGGVQPTKSTTVQVDDQCGMLEAYAEVDRKLADLNDNTKEFRLSEDRGHIEGINQEFVNTLFYGNDSTTPEEFTGFSARFNDQTAANGDNILTSAAAPDNSDNTSIYLIVWGANTVHGIYPKGMKGGLAVTDKGQVTIENIDGNGGRMEAYRTHYSWDCGLCVRDWRYVVRIQIDQEDLTSDANSGPSLIDLMAEAIDMVPSINMGRPAFYANRRVRSYLRRQMMNKIASSTLTLEQLERPNGAFKRVPAVDGVPVHRCDALLNTEAAVKTS